MTTTSARVAIHWRVKLRQKTAKTARWLHIYLSMVSFAIVLFFAVTGLTLNHPDWFSGAVKTRESQGTVAHALLQPPGGARPDVRALAEDLRTREHLHGTVDDPRIDDTEISFSYKAPGYTADVIIDRSNSTYSVTEVRNGFVAVMNDLHRGRDAGKAWAWLIDVSAVLLTLVSLTGLLILWFVYRRRASGLVMAAAGLVLCLLAYKVFVP